MGGTDGDDDSRPSSDEEKFASALPLEPLWRPPAPNPQRNTVRVRLRELLLPAAILLGLVVLCALGLHLTDETPSTERSSGSRAPQVAHPTSDTNRSRIVLVPGSVPMPGTTEFLLTQRSYDVGDCVTWDQTVDDRYLHDATVVPCDEPHLVEMAGDVQMTTTTDQFPSKEEWAAANSVDCTQPAELLLGTKVDPAGRYFVTALTPSRDSWSRGDRTLHCALGARDGSEREIASIRLAFTGKARGSAQQLLYPIGTCLDELSSTPCEGPHLLQVTGHVDLTGRIVAVPAANDNASWDRIVGSECTQALALSVGPVAPAVRSGWMPIRPESWAAGSQILHCVGGVTAPDSNAFVPSVGPLAPTY